MSFPTISLIQPWAWLILRPDVVGVEARQLTRDRWQMKDMENRTWPTSVRGWVLVHASKTRLAKWDHQAAEMFAAKRGVELPLRDSHTYGAVVGAMRIDACVGRSPSPWFVGPYGFAIGAAVPFATPVACNGAQLIFPLPPAGAGPGGAELAGLLAAQIRAAGLAEVFRLGAAT